MSNQIGNHIGREHILLIGLNSNWNEHGHTHTLSSQIVIQFEHTYQHQIYKEDEDESEHTTKVILTRVKKTTRWKIEMNQSHSLSLLSQLISRRSEYIVTN